MSGTERYYKSSYLGKWFAIASIIFLVTMVWTFADDYLREWKGYQRDFRKLEISKTRAEISEKEAQLEQQSEYQDLLQQLEEARAELAAKADELAAAEERLSELKAEHYRDNQNFLFAKADFDAAKYAYEEAVARGVGDLEEAKRELDEHERHAHELKLVFEQTETKLKEQEAVILGFNNQVKNLEGELAKLGRDKITLERKLQQVDPAEMSFGNKLANMVRDLPVLDFLAPYYKIDQIILSDIVDDVNFAQVPKVDRCVTCHQGITKPEFADDPQPFKAHPRPELFLSSSSPHPIGEFGCTGCHAGRGRGTSFFASVHVPSTDEQQKEWQEKYDWHKMELWEKPMYPLKYAEAGCFSCHAEETLIRGADKLNLGLNLIERAGCFGCHKIEKYKDKRRIGPDLNRIASKVNKEWAYRWILHPKAFKHNTWMPRFFRQFNTSDEASVKRTDQEIHAIVHYLFKQSGTFDMQRIPVRGNAARGEELVASLGCYGCHRMELEPTERETSLQSLRRDHGPNLIGLGSKTSKEWIYNWLKAPERYFPETKMPNLRLSNQEAADIAEFLWSVKHESFMKTPIPEVDEAQLDEIVVEFQMKLDTEAGAREMVAKMSLEEKLDFSGERLIRLYGCFGCHNIPGFENEKPIGTELTKEGDKPVDKLDFGFIDIERTNHVWFKTKLMNPRIFDKDRVRPATEKLRMPNFEFTEAEAEAIVTALLGFVKPDVLPSKIKPRTARNEYVEQGQWIIREYNCQGCHLVEGDGAAIRPMVNEWLRKVQKRDPTEADALTIIFSPPNLIGEGKKVQTEWLYHFLRGPKTIRPWLKVRMPTFAFTQEQVNTLIRFFSYLDHQDFPFVDSDMPKLSPAEYRAGKTLFSKDYFSCGSCHIAGSKMPSGEPENWAPDFALAKERLKPDWIIEWLMDPQVLLPGTKMPTFFDPEYFDESGPDDILDGDEHKQIRALRDYILTIK